MELYKFNTYHTLKYIEGNTNDNPIMEKYIREWNKHRNNWANFATYNNSANPPQYYCDVIGTITWKDNSGQTKTYSSILKYVPSSLANSTKQVNFIDKHR